MKLFGRRSHGGSADLARIASFENLAEQQKEVEDEDRPNSQPQIRVLSDEELFGKGDTGPGHDGPAGARDAEQFRPLTDDMPAARPSSLGLRSLTSISGAGVPADLEMTSERLDDTGSEAGWVKSGRGSLATSGDAPAIIGADILIGGEEADLVPLIPDTKPEAESADLDDETSAAAAVDALRGACDLLVDRIQRMRALRDGARFISAMISVVTELDAKYAEDWGIVRRNGLEEVLDDVRAAVAEGDRFILESLENGQGGMTDEAFVRDLKTVAMKDRPRIIAEYTIFLVFVYRCVLLQYLRPLEQDAGRLNEMMSRLDYLIDGVREILIQHVNAHVQG